MGATLGSENSQERACRNPENRFDVYGALWMLCNRWHSGQDSLGYLILSRLSVMDYKPGLSVQRGRFESEEQRQYYRFFYKKLRDRL